MSIFDALEERFTPLIVKVRKSGYVPPGITVRSQIGDYIFTADCENMAALNAAREDVNVESVAVSERLMST